MHVASVQNISNIARDNIKTIQCSLNPNAVLDVALKDDVAGRTVADSTVVERPVPFVFGTLRRTLCHCEIDLFLQHSTRSHSSPDERRKSWSSKQTLW